MPSATTDYLRTFQLGDATVTIMNIGNIRYPLSLVMNASAEELAQRGDLAGLLTQQQLPVFDVHIRLPGTSLLVDAGIYDLSPEFAVPNYTPPPSLIEQLAQVGVAPDAIEHVIITHAHWDHFSGTTTGADGYVPLFPNAHYYLGAADWAQVEPALGNPAALEYRTLRVLDQHGVLVPVSDETALAEGAAIIPAPGETPGHQILRVQSKGQTLYCLGDLYHHVAEILHPELMVNWADAEAMQRSRAWLTERALAENALLTATHIPDIGRLVQGADGLAWQAVY